MMKMLADPLIVNYNGSSKSLPVVTGNSPSIDNHRTAGLRMYATPDGEFTVVTRQGLLRDGSRKAEIYLSRNALETDTNTVWQGYFRNSVGLSFVTDPSGANGSDIALIRSALETLVGPTLQGRLISGEV